MNDVQITRRLDRLERQLKAIGRGERLAFPASGFKVGSIRIRETLAGILEATGIIRLYYGTNAQRAASTKYLNGVAWWTSDTHDLYVGNGSAWQLIGGASGAPPGAHHTTHENSGADEIDVSGLSGVLADDQPSDHATPIAAHAGDDDAHHAKYTDAEALAAAKAGAGITDDDLMQVDDADAAANDIAQFTASGLQGLSYAELLAALSGQAGADFSLNSHKLTALAAAAANGQAIRYEQVVGLIAAAGDILYGSAAATLAKLTISTNGKFLKVVSGLPSWQWDEAAIEYVIDGGGSVISTGYAGGLEVPFDCFVTGWTITAQDGNSGSIVVDVWKDSYANFPPTVADTIAGTEKLTISASNKGQDLTLTTWTQALTKGDWLGFNVDSCSTLTRVTLSLRVDKYRAS